MSLSISYLNYNVIFEIKILRNIRILKKKNSASYSELTVKLLAQNVLDHLRFKGVAPSFCILKGVPPSYLAITSLKNVVGGNAEFTISKT